jgi:uncharacterized membrane protein (DUF2068 family)
LGEPDWENREASFNVEAGGCFLLAFAARGSDRHPLKSSAKSRQRHNRWLILIALFKLVQAVLFIAIGVGVRRLLHKNIGDELLTLADHLRFNPESHLVNLILVKASIVDDKMLRRISAVFFLYAALDIVEGTGLYLEKMWGEFFTLIITASFLPWEIYEVVRRLTWPRVSLLTINALVLLYLAKVIWERQRPSARRSLAK